MSASWDVIVVGAGPAGAVAALVLARAGARVLVVDRQREPGGKLCGDTLNPGAVALLESLGAAGGPVAAAPALTGWLVTGPGVSVRSEYRAGQVGRAVERRLLDPWLLERAVGAGAVFEGGVLVRRARVADERGSRHVTGIGVAGREAAREYSLDATVTIASDGRASVVGRSMGLTTFRASTRRWAFGGYVSGLADVGTSGEMHVRAGGYVGIAPVGGGRCKVCAVTGPRPAGRTPAGVLRGIVGRDASLGARFAAATVEPEVRAIGPLGVEARAPGCSGLLLAGDAAGFVDPMTGDGLHLAMRGGLLAALEALRVLESGDRAGAVRRLARARRDAFGGKLRFNRALTRITASPAGVAAAARVVSAVPSLARWLVARAGDAA